MLTVVGARPQFVKAAVVSRALQLHGLNEVMLHTGQHFDANMSQVFFDELGIPQPRYNLGVGGGGHGANTGRALEQIERVIEDQAPACVLVYGDTDSTLAGALAAAKLCVPVAHVEAGLRSYNRRMPEEVNRVLTDHVSTLLFAPSSVAVANLERESIAGPQVRMVGDVMCDAVAMFGRIAAERSRILESLQLNSGQYVLATLHRKENTDDPARLEAILRGLSASELPVVLPLHPRTRKRIAEFGLSCGAAIRLVDPVGYLDMMRLESGSALIATDSGGVQKEAYFHRVACLTLRDETEWVELLEIGANRLVGADSEAIAAGLCDRAFRASNNEVYGDGRAADRIAEALRVSI